MVWASKAEMRKNVTTKKPVLGRSMHSLSSRPALYSSVFRLAQESTILRYRVTRYEKHAKRNKPHRLANDRAYHPNSAMKSECKPGAKLPVAWQLLRSGLAECACICQIAVEPSKVHSVEDVEELKA